MWGQWHCLEIWEDCSHSSQLCLSEGSSEFIFVIVVGSDVLLGTEFSCLITGDKLGVEFHSKDAIGGAEIVGVNSIRHRIRVIGFVVWSERGDGVLAHCSCPYMCLCSSL